jgi:hypothetical protein
VRNDLPAVLERPDLAVPEPASQVVVGAKWRTIRARPYGGPVDRPRSVVMPAGLVALAICVAPGLLFLLLAEVAR